MKSFDLVMDIRPSNQPAAVQAIAGAPTQPAPKKGESDTSPKTLPPTPQQPCVR